MVSDVDNIEYTTLNEEQEEALKHHQKDHPLPSTDSYKPSHISEI